MSDLRTNVIDIISNGLDFLNRLRLLFREFSKVLKYSSNIYYFEQMPNKVHSGPGDISKPLPSISEALARVLCSGLVTIQTEYVDLI